MEIVNLTKRTNKTGKFMGRAFVIVEKGFVALQSYHTIVAVIKNGTIYGCNQNYGMCYSVTTMKHLMMFLREYGPAGWEKSEAFIKAKTCKQFFASLPPFKGYIDAVMA